MLQHRLRRLGRSVLFLPGINQRALDKLHSLSCDAAILDLEDAVSPQKKAEARSLVCAAAKKAYGPHKEIAIRINPLNSDWGHDDLALAVESGAHALVIPKVDTAETLQQVAHAMDEMNAPSDMSIWAMIETPLGVLNVQSIAASHPRLSTLVAGTSDLSKELQCTTTPCRHAVVPSLAMILLAAKAYRLRALDGVHLDLDNTADFMQQLQQGKEMGFDGKTLIHPKTIAATNECFSPSMEQVQHAKEVIQAYDAAIAVGDGMAVLHGKLIENLHVEMAQDVLAMHEMIQQSNAASKFLLFVPGLNQELLQKLPSLKCDAAMLDLEDGVSPLRKDEARSLISSAVRNGFGQDKEIAIRINSLDSPWGHHDLEMAVAAGPNALIVPKVNSPDTLLNVIKAMESLNPPSNMQLWAMIETPKGILNVDSIAQTHPRLSCLIAGTSDLSKELQCIVTPCRHALVPSLAMIVLAAKAHGLMAIDGVHFDLNKTKEFAQQVQQGAEMGFDGKTLMHYQTIDSTNKAFSPTSDQLHHANEILKAKEEAIKAGHGLIIVNDKFIEQTYVEMAEEIVTKQRLIDSRKSE
ncbi:(3S)-malyl-CoA thiolesterase [Thraustotheca clavata]|uniref:(3S)-malyl-CoA thiolesterase n=1 Tax=Thraustotheca clavata TaxID=74557 RepID=A0A1V9YZ39_9STRA|nr:(3S)-malyl-CoA thiolesterase [Thraustotheca clavata]